MKLDLQYFHVIVFMFLIAYLDAYFFLIMFFFWADNENDEDEFDEAADDLHFEILQFMIRTKAIDLKGAQFDKTKFMLNEFEFLGGVWEYWVEMWEIPTATEDMAIADFVEPTYDFEGQATSFILESLKDQEFTENLNYKQSPAYFFLSLGHIKKKKNSKNFYKNKDLERKLKKTLKIQEEKRAQYLSNKLTKLFIDKKIN